VERNTEAVARVVFDKTFAEGAAFNRIIGETKKLLRINAFTPVKVLIQMDLNGGTLQYEGIFILNNVEAASFNGDKLCYINFLLCTLPCLKWVAKVFEVEGD
jgi:hypothetical protein